MAFIDVLEIKVCEHCNYSCVGCGSFSNLAKREEYGIERLKKELSRIKELIGNIREVRLYGGEPFLSKELTEYTKTVREYLPNTKLVLITNGTLLYKQTEKIYAELKRDNAEIFVSYYPKNNDLIDDGIERAKSYGITVTKAQIDLFYVKMTDKKNPGDIQSRFNKCHVMCKGAVYLDRGRVYACPYAPNFRHYDSAYNVKYEFIEDGYNIFDEHANPEDFADKMRQPLKACQYCSDDMLYVKWQQAKPEKENWLCNSSNKYIID